MFAVVLGEIPDATGVDAGFADEPTGRTRQSSSAGDSASRAVHCNTTSSPRSPPTASAHTSRG
jgi:hypothetical protein